MGLEENKTSTTITITISGIAYHVIIKKQSDVLAKNGFYMPIQRAVNESLRRLDELESMIERGEIIYTSTLK